MVNVIKANGENEQFSKDKLRYSIKRAGIPRALENKVLEHVMSKLYNGIPTSEVYRHITEFLSDQPNRYKAKYGLKQAIMDFGPTGHPFEDLVSEIFKKEGYATQVRSILSGKCVTHEIDVIAQKQSENIMVEAKFHNTSGTRTDVHVSLYTKSRFDDVKNKYNLTKALIATNTKVTSDALSYALCVGMEVVSWSYPQNKSLRDLVENLNLHPVTILTTLSQSQKQKLLEEHVVLCKKILDNADILDLIELSQNKKLSVIEEIKNILGS